MATLSRGERADPCLDKLLLFFQAPYIKEGPPSLHRFVLGGYLLQTKEKMSLNTSKEDICNVKGEMVKKRLCSIPGRSSSDFGKIKILSKHLLPQFRVRKFQQEQVSQQSRYNAGLISHWRTYPWTQVLPANLTPHWLFRVGAEPHFPRVEQFPTISDKNYSLFN